MKLGFISNLRAPYRTLQLEEWSKINGIKLTAYYTDAPSENRKWNLRTNNNFNEVDLKNDNKRFSIKKILRIVTENDVIVIGGYEKKEYILASLIGKFLNKKIILLFDGISTNRINEKENFIKQMIKKYVVYNSKFIFGNGKVSEEYFNKQFGYPIDRIINQYLTVDVEKIQNLSANKSLYREQYRRKYNIDSDEKVLMYSGRLIDIKNVYAIIKGLSQIKRTKVTFFILGGGVLEENIKKMSEELGVKTVISGFIEDQSELFKQYSVGDAFILASTNEVWGLAVNEAMAFGLPVIVSNICGCSLDLVKEGENGYIINPYDIEDISEKIEYMFSDDKYVDYGDNSKLIIKNWTFENSKNNLEKLLNKL